MPKAPIEREEKDRRTIRIILAMVAAGWVLALVLMGLVAVFWDRQ